MVDVSVVQVTRRCRKLKTPVKPAEGAYKAVCEGRLAQSLLDELHNQLEARKAERGAEKPIGTKLNSDRARLQRATTRGAKAKTAMKELTEANTELQELTAGSIVPEVSTDGSDVDTTPTCTRADANFSGAHTTVHSSQHFSNVGSSRSLEVKRNL